MSESIKTVRPVYRNISIFQIAGYRLPLAGIISILHRISGALLFLLLPYLLFKFNQSITSEMSFYVLQESLSSVWVKLVLLVLAWAYLHHFCAGVRHLFMDVHMGLEVTRAKHSAIAVFAVSLPLTLLVGLKLFGVF